MEQTIGAGLPKTTLSLFGEDDHREAVEVLTESFCRNDPVESALSVSPREFRTMINLELEAVPRNELSMVLRDSGDGRMVAVAIATDATAPAVDSCAPASPKFAPIADIASRFRDLYFSSRTIIPGSTVYLFAMCVLPCLSGRGLGRLTAGATMRNAREKGYRTAYSMTTNVPSGRVLRSLGFDVISRIRYRDYRYEDRAVFASITDHPSIDLMECPDLRKVPCA